MPETLILHVKGTEAETTELPVETVRSAIAEGQLTESQLIWSPEENIWKQVRELPHLREEMLTLHVKGTEAETITQPRRAVRAKIKQGDISHSQLIWRPEEHTWKQVRELPELLPSQKLAPAPARPPIEPAPAAVHTPDSPTSPVARVAVRASRSPADRGHAPVATPRPQIAVAPRTIPQVRIATEAPTAAPQPHIAEASRVVPQVRIATETPAAAPQPRIVEAPRVIPQVRVAVEAPTTAPQPHIAEASRVVPQVRIATETPAAAAQLHVAEAPRVIPQVRVAAEAPTTAPQPHIAEASRVVPQVRIATETPAGTPEAPAAVPTSHESPATRRIARPMVVATPQPVPQVRVVAATPNPTATPQVRVATAQPSATPRVKAVATPTATPVVKAQPQATVKVKQSAPRRSTAHLEVKSDDESHPLKWLCIGLGALIVLIIGGNYLLVDQPLASGMGQSPYTTAPVFAHLGAFVQPNVLVIHVRTAPLTADHLSDYLVTLAHNTPQSPFSHQAFDRVAITTGWLAHYTITGGNWQQLGDMPHDNKDAQKNLLLDFLCDGGGQKLVEVSPLLDHDAVKAERDKVWSTVTAYFISK